MKSLILVVKQLKAEMLNLLRQVTSQSLVVQGCVVPHLKALICHNHKPDALGCGRTLRICHALLKNDILLSEMAKQLTFIFGKCSLYRA